jgi:hypothetical protein
MDPFLVTNKGYKRREKPLFLTLNPRFFEEKPYKTLLFLVTFKGNVQCRMVTFNGNAE